ncbi:hypothetical protein [Streptomyces mirabilis]
MRSSPTTAAARWVEPNWGVARTGLLALTGHPRHERCQRAPGSLPFRQIGGGAEPVPHLPGLGVGVGGGVLRGDLGGDGIGQVLGLGQVAGDVDTVAGGPPLDKGLPPRLWPGTVCCG